MWGECLRVGACTKPRCSAWKHDFLLTICMNIFPCHRLQSQFTLTNSRMPGNGWTINQFPVSLGVDSFLSIINSASKQTLVHIMLAHSNIPIGWFHRIGIARSKYVCILDFNRWCLNAFQRGYSNFQCMKVPGGYSEEITDSMWGLVD